MGRSLMIQLALGMVAIGLIVGIVVLSIQVSNCNKTGSPIRCDPDSTKLDEAQNVCVAKHVVGCDSSSTYEKDNICYGIRAAAKEEKTSGSKVSKSVMITLIIVGVVGAVILILGVSKGYDRDENLAGLPFRTLKRTFAATRSRIGALGRATGFSRRPPSAPPGAAAE